jgi:hypothetical protein
LFDTVTISFDTVMIPFDTVKRTVHKNLGGEEKLMLRHVGGVAFGSPPLGICHERRTSFYRATASVASAEAGFDPYTYDAANRVALYAFPTVETIAGGQNFGYHLY